MNKAELIEAASKASGETKTATAKVLAALTEIIYGADKVSLTGFGTFERVKRAARTCRNPQTGGKVEVPAKVVLTFKAAKSA